MEQREEHFALRIADCGFKNEESGVRIQNSEDKYKYKNLSHLLTTGY